MEANNVDTNDNGDVSQEYRYTLHSSQNCQWIFYLDTTITIWSKSFLMGFKCQFSSVQSLRRVRIFATPWIAARQASLSITNSRSSLRLTSIESVMPSSHLILCRPLLSCPQTLPASEFFPMSQHFAGGGQSIGVSTLASFFPKKPRADLLQNGLVGSPRSPRDSQESFPTPQFKSINSSALSFLYSPTLTSIHDHWKNHSLD